MDLWLGNSHWKVYLPAFIWTRDQYFTVLALVCLVWWSKTSLIHPDVQIKGYNWGMKSFSYSKSDGYSREKKIFPSLPLNTPTAYTCVTFWYPTVLNIIRRMWLILHCASNRNLESLELHQQITFFPSWGVKCWHQRTPAFAAICSVLGLQNIRI